MVSAPKRVTLSAFVQGAAFPSLVKVRSFAVKKSLLSNDPEKTVSLRLTFAAEMAWITRRAGWARTGLTEVPIAAAASLAINQSEFVGSIGLLPVCSSLLQD
jgi:hypothetical protein